MVHTVTTVGISWLLVSAACAPILARLLRHADHGRLTVPVNDRRHAA
jgi:hypothetical protein